MIPPSQALWILVVLSVVWLALFFRLGTLPLLQPDEGRNAEVAREMKESGAWLSPSYNGIAYLDKPAFYFKAVALSLAAFGDNETAARLPSALFGLALLAITYAFCRRVQGPRCAVMAIIIIASMPLFIVFSRTVIFDMTLAFFVSAAIFAGHLAEAGAGASRRGWYLAGAGAAGCATLVKGPVGFLIPGLVLFMFHFIEGRRGVWKRFFAPANLFVFFGVTLPWFIGLSLQHRDFPYYGLVEESFHRFTTTTFHRSQPFYFYALIVLALFLPWSFMLPEAAIAAWKNKRLLSSADRLCVVWAVVVVVFFSLSKSKLPGYILTATLPCGMLTARVFERALARPDGRAARIVLRAAVTLAVLCLAVAIAALLLPLHMPALAKPLGLPVEIAGELGRHFWVAAVLLSTFAVLGCLSRFRRDAGFCFAVFAAFPLLLFTLNLGAIETVFNYKSARQLAQHMPALPPGTGLVFWECFPNGLPFYLGRTAVLFTKDGSEITSSSNYILYQIKNSPQWPTNLVPVGQFAPWLAARKKPVYLLARADEKFQLQAIAGVPTNNLRQLTPQYAGVLLPAP